MSSDVVTLYYSLYHVGNVLFCFMFWHWWQSSNLLYRHGTLLRKPLTRVWLLFHRSSFITSDLTYKMGERVIISSSSLGSL